MIAARTGSGRLRNRPVKKTRVSATTIEVTTSAAGDVAPFMSFTAVCDMPPDTGKPRTSATATLDAPRAVSSCAGSIS
jgi:hypothetical protein